MPLPVQVQPALPDWGAGGIAKPRVDAVGTTYTVLTQSVVAEVGVIGPRARQTEGRGFRDSPAITRDDNPAVNINGADRSRLPVPHYLPTARRTSRPRDYNICYGGTAPAHNPLSLCPIYCNATRDPCPTDFDPDFPVSLLIPIPRPFGVFICILHI
jgi:hypothetical protein